MPWVRFCAEESTRNPGGDIYFLPIPLCLECAKFAYKLIVCTSHFFFRFLKNFPCQREKCPSRQQKRLFLEFSKQKKNSFFVCVTPYILSMSEGKDQQCFCIESFFARRAQQDTPHLGRILMKFHVDLRDLKLGSN